MKNKIIVDIDGTIANLDHRLPYILNEDGSQKKAGEKDWNMFGKFISHDNPRKIVIDMINRITEGVYYENIYFITGRSDQYRKETIKWLEEHFRSFEPKNLLMRPSVNRDQDDDLKRQIINRDIEEGKPFPKDEITHVFEDRPRCLKMYREELPNAIIVDCGNFNHFKDER